MNASARAAGAPHAPHAHPSLFASKHAHPTGMADPADSVRILDSLVPQPAARRARRASTRWMWAAGAGFMVLALIGALYGVMQAQGAAQPRQVVVSRAESVVERTAAPRTSPASTAGDIEPVQAARIESDPQTSLQSTAASVADPFHALNQASPNTSAAATAAGAHGKGHATKAASSKAAGSEADAKAAPRVAALTPTTRRRADSDVDLLEAMVAHVSGRPAAAGSKPAPKAGHATLGKADRHDVVQRQTPASESVAELVQRCRAVGGLEGLLCRNRVCDGHWGSDAACPANRPPGPQEP